MKNPKVFTERPYAQKIKFESFFRKDPPQLLLMYIFKTQNGILVIPRKQIFNMLTKSLKQIYS